MRRDATVLVVAGLDPTGGAGLAADLEALAAVGVRGQAGAGRGVETRHHQHRPVPPHRAPLVAATTRPA